jgi:hypothetical protein
MLVPEQKKSHSKFKNQLLQSTMQKYLEKVVNDELHDFIYSSRSFELSAEVSHVTSVHNQ